MQPNGFQLVNVCSLRCELFAKHTGYGCVYVSGGMLLWLICYVSRRQVVGFYVLQGGKERRER